MNVEWEHWKGTQGGGRARNAWLRGTQKTYNEHTWNIQTRETREARDKICGRTGQIGHTAHGHKQICYWPFGHLAIWPFAIWYCPSGIRHLAFAMWHWQSGSGHMAFAIWHWLLALAI